MPNLAKLGLFGGTTLLITLSGLLIALWPTISERILHSELELNPGSIGYKMWQKTPVPMYIDIYLYDWTNPEDVKNKTIKPTFRELGPYVFSEVHERVNVSWQDGDLVEFNQIRTYHFVPELSNGSLSDNVTNLNPVAVTAAYVVRNSSAALMFLNGLFISYKTKISVTKTVGEWLFDGYQDDLLDLLHTINNTLIPKYDKFGWFYGRNLSWSYDGLFEMHTGHDDINNLGVLTRWNNMSKTPYHDSYCGMVNGTTGELWPPANHTNNITLFISDICRSMTLGYKYTDTIEGLEGRVYTGGQHFLDNGELYPENECFCSNPPREGSCPFPTGVVDVSNCRFGAPAFISYPHFYLADPIYTDNISIPNAATDKDTFSINLEPGTGIPLEVNAKLQINLLMLNLPEVLMFKGIRDAFMPAIWFNMRTRLTPELASTVNLALHLPMIGITIFSVLIVVGVIIFCIGIYMALWGRWSIRSRRADEASLIDDTLSDNTNVENLTT